MMEKTYYVERIGEPELEPSGLDIRMKPGKELLEEKMSILYDFGVFDRSKRDAPIRKECADKLKACETVLGLEKIVQDIIRDNFDKMDLLMIK